MKRPRILITRTRHQASELAAQLELLGAETIVVPAIEIAAPTSFEALDAAIFSLGKPFNEIDWTIFTSANAVQALNERSRAMGIRPLLNRVGVIGPATAKGLELLQLAPEMGPVLVPPKFVAESLAEALLSEAGGEPRHFLLLRAEEARDVIPDTLRSAGHRVTVVSAYRNVTPDDALSALARIFAAPEHYPDVITLTSSSTARNLIALLGSIRLTIPPGIALASIGPITSATLRELGYEPTLEAAEPTIYSLARAISVHLNLQS